jgi:hypothetical protein
MQGKKTDVTQLMKIDASNVGRVPHYSDHTPAHHSLRAFLEP